MQTTASAHSHGYVSPGVGQKSIPNEDVGRMKLYNMHKIIAEWQGWFDVRKFEIEDTRHEQEAEQVKVDPLEAEKMDVSKTEQVLQGRSISTSNSSFLLLQRPEPDLQASSSPPLLSSDVVCILLG